MRILLLVLIGLLVLPACADDKAEIQALVAKRKVQKRTRLVIEDGWARSDWIDGNASGFQLMRKLEGKWLEVSFGGGAIDAKYAYQMGVPKGLLKALSHTTCDAAEIQEAVSQGPAWEWIEPLQDDILGNRSPYELNLMRNEIYAVHGKIFQDAFLKAYFEGRAWYKPRADYSDALLTDLERQNLAIIEKYQKR